ncbi:hypothetical protein F1737_08020 [Methanoplanus sp. FWC-SCC4]|uniref:Uncharacterized protein n=1 Tax=Methanochimaera problematica TaxID=2609417 RepID=A0AA97FE75_9EURY|nr:hypothetical protein [Methanoplanus sp. FWC-SCC4]WOF16638.1 hypothetical protein F1737_08020 [Methanoplanus sp. FWC-SCC4]
MAQVEALQKMSETRAKYLKQANARMKDIRGMESDIRRRMTNAPVSVQNELDNWFVNLESYMSQAGVEIEMVEHSTEDEWAKMRQRVDSALGEAERELEMGYEILERPGSAKTRR